MNDVDAINASGHLGISDTLATTASSVAGDFFSFLRSCILSAELSNGTKLSCFLSVGWRVISQALLMSLTTRFLRL